MNRSGSASRTSNGTGASSGVKIGANSRSRDKRMARETVNLKNEKNLKPPLGSAVILPS